LSLKKTAKGNLDTNTCQITGLSKDAARCLTGRFPYTVDVWAKRKRTLFVSDVSKDMVLTFIEYTYVVLMSWECL